MQCKMKPKYQVHFIKEIVRSLEHAARSLTRNKSLSAPPELEVVPGAIRPQSEMELSVRLHFYHQRRQLLSILSKKAFLSPEKGFGITLKLPFKNVSKRLSNYLNISLEK